MYFDSEAQDRLRSSLGSPDRSGGSRSAKQIFHTRVQLLYAQELRDMNDPSKPDMTVLQMKRMGWLQMAAVTNTSAAFGFRMLAQKANAMQTYYEHCTERDYMTNMVWAYDPLTYLENNRLRIPRTWGAVLHQWEASAPDSNQSRNYRRQRWVEVQTLQQEHANFRRMLPGVESVLREEYWETDSEAVKYPADPFSALRAAKHISAELLVIEKELVAFLTTKETDTPRSLSLDQGPPASTGNELRRRKHLGTQGISNDADDDEKTPRMYSGALHNEAVMPNKLTAAIASFVSLMKLTAEAARTFFQDAKMQLPRPSKLMQPSQATLLILSLATSCASGLLVGLGLAQSRPADCVPSPRAHDDGFYGLVSQLLLQLLAVYCTVIPLARDGAVSLSKPWFGSSLGASALAAAVAPAVYGASWRLSMVMSFVSGFASLMASVQLAGGVQRYQQGLG